MCHGPRFGLAQQRRRLVLLASRLGPITVPPGSVEEQSYRTVRDVIGCLPAIAAGAALSFARGISEYGSLVLLSGNLPNRTEVVSVRVLTYIENGNPSSAAAAATLMLMVALAVIVALDVLQRRVARRG